MVSPWRLWRLVHLSSFWNVSGTGSLLKRALPQDFQQLFQPIRGAMLSWIQVSHHGFRRCDQTVAARGFSEGLRECWYQRHSMANLSKEAGLPSQVEISPSFPSKDISFLPVR